MADFSALPAMAVEIVVIFYSFCPKAGKALTEELLVCCQMQRSKALDDASDAAKWAMLVGLLQV
jgi:hypothetical protein